MPHTPHTVRPELVEGLSFFLANAEILSQSPRISAIFFALLQPLIRRSASKASIRVENSWLQTRATGNLSAVNPGNAPDSCCAMRCARLSVWRSEEHTSELQSLMRISYAVFCLKK